MREILFRGKWTDSGKWVEGSLIVWKDGSYSIDSGSLVETMLCVIPDTVGQFTGLTDKNGKKIFDGDVVLYPWNDQDNPEIFTIKFKDGQFVASPVKETEDYWDFMVGGYSKEMEVIGNIHDNHDLLEGGAEDGDET